MTALKRRCVATAGVVGIVVGWPQPGVNVRRTVDVVAHDALADFDRVPSKHRAAVFTAMLYDVAQQAKDFSAFDERARSGRRKH